VDCSLRRLPRPFRPRPAAGTSPTQESETLSRYFLIRSRQEPISCRVSRRKCRTGRRDRGRSVRQLLSKMQVIFRQTAVPGRHVYQAAASAQTHSVSRAAAATRCGPTMRSCWSRWMPARVSSRQHLQRHRSSLALARSAPCCQLVRAAGTIAQRMEKQQLDLQKAGEGADLVR
jgi:hypothetical protein